MGASMLTAMELDSVARVVADPGRHNIPHPDEPTIPLVAGHPDCGAASYVRTVPSGAVIQCARCHKHLARWVKGTKTWAVLEGAHSEG